MGKDSVFSVSKPIFSSLLEDEGAQKHTVIRANSETRLAGDIITVCVSVISVDASGNFVKSLQTKYEKKKFIQDKIGYIRNKHYFIRLLQIGQYLLVLIIVQLFFFSFNFLISRHARKVLPKTLKLKLDYVYVEALERQ